MSEGPPVITDLQGCSRWRNSQTWTPPRTELRAALHEIDPYLAELYEGAVSLLYDCPIPGRARLIAHAVREIGNALPEKIAGQSFPTRFDPTNDLDELVSLWSKHGLPLDGLATVSNDSAMNAVPGGGSVHLPRRLFDKIARLIKRHGLSRTTNRDKAVELFKACDPQNPAHIKFLAPVLKQWSDVVGWFVKVTHDRKSTDDEILKGKLLTQFALFETGLRAMVTDFFGSASEELDDILENANS